MKKIVFFFALLLLSQFLSSQTNISGTLSGTLTLANSPYLVQGHIMIAQNSTLVIDPGVVLELQNHFKINVQGVLLAKGTVIDSIKFKMNPSMQSTGWWGIRFEMTPASQDSSILQYCNISGGYSNGTGDDSKGGGILIKSFSKVRVDNCLIHHNKALAGAGISLHYTNALIDNNRIIHNTVINGWNTCGGGIFCDSLSYCRISNNEIGNNTVTNKGIGGGLGCVDSSPLVFGNNIHHNSGYPDGGGVCFFSCIGTFSNNIVNANTSYNNGAGIFMYFSSTIIESNTITNNVAVSQGGGIYVEAMGFPVFNANNISFNTAAYGAGMAVISGQRIAITSNTIHGNKASDLGGGLNIQNSNTRAINNIISNNFSDKGGAISSAGDYLLSAFVGNVIVNNTSNKNGGAMFLQTASPMISNCTFANNYSGTQPSYTTYLYGGGGIFCTAASNPTITNSIFWKNSSLSSNGNQIYLEDNASDPPIINCILDGGQNAMYTNGSVYSGTFTNNLIADPLFILESASTGTASNGLAANWRLNSLSPAINSGKKDSAGLVLPLNDRDGNLRIKGIIDRGAYETPGCGNFSVNTSIFQSGAALTTTQVGSAYQWLDCNSNFKPIAGQVQPAFVPSVNGSYSLKITQFGCTDSSSCFLMMAVDIKELIENKINVFPNPTENSVTISGLQSGEIVEIWDVNLRLIQSFPVTQTSTVIHIENPGVYLVKLKSSSSEFTKKIVVQN